MPAVLKKYMDEYTKFYAADRAKEKTAAEKIFAEQEKVANDAYSKAVKDTKISYEDQHRENAIQKLINENEVAEDMANMGHNDSGLNRTQQTAVQLSYANNRSSINRQKQAQLDTFAQNLAAELSSIRQNRISTIADIDKEYDSAVASSAQAAYKTYQDAETDRIKENNRHIEKMAEGKPLGIINSKNGILSRQFIGGLNENGVSVTYKTDEYGNKVSTTYTDRNTGYSSTFNYDTNPFTNTVNPDTKYGVFKNGYQPDNIGSKKLEDTGEKGNINGKEQRLYRIGGSNRRGTENYWIWDGLNNKYIRVYDEDGKWVVYR